MRLNLDRLKRLLQQILDFRRIENNLMELKVSQEHLPAFINQLSHVFFSPLAVRKNIEFEINHGECTTDIYYDADKMDKILFNLLSNAFKYTPKDGKITLSYYIKEDNRQKLLYLFVRDNGMGIDKDELDKIFKPFYTNKSFVNQESNGIGLSVTKELVDIHFGKISVESLPDQGTCFQITLPVDKEFYLNKGYQIWDESFPKKDQLIYEINDVETVIHEITSGELHKLHILLVEDNEDLQQTMSSILSKKYLVHVASDGKQGLDLLNKVDIDIIVSDIMMPEMDGLSLCRAVKQHTEINHIPVLLLTAKNSIEDRIECYQAGADGYISKPFDIKVLEAKIQSFIINKRTKQINFNNNTQINIATLDYTPVDEQFLQRIIKVVEENLGDDQFDIIKLGEILALSKSTLYRKTKVLLDLSPSEFIKNIRLKHACQMMEKDKSITVSEVAFATGFSDPRYFATCFKASFGITPTEFQKNTTVQHV
ncbi:response regulator [Sphingobacterium faecium]|nr:response regulator [Sphingobacterium faecium]UXD69693.1 response regulator [Sphingobacterium faecium]